MPSRDDLRHDQSSYERPHQPYRCGRAATWGMPCWQGPDTRGRCGGAAQCSPVRHGDRWECRRPSHGGGPCEQGPLPDGQCCLVRAPCQPILQTRRWRGRLSALAVMVVLAFIAAFSSTAPDALTGALALDAGPLSRAHAGFIGADNCQACHSAHEQSGLAWLTGLAQPHDNDARCLECHTFGGPGSSPHNLGDLTASELPRPGCGTCHAEHQGAAHDLTRVDDRTCGNCHAQRFTSFVEGHPPFPASYPTRAPGRIYFDHARHINVHFPDLAAAERDPAASAFATRATSGCEACHRSAGADETEVRPLPYAQTCAVCHDAQIRERALSLFGYDEPTAFGAMLMGLDYDDADLYDRGLELREELADEGLAPLLEALGEWQLPQGPTLLAGLSSELVQTATRAWVEEDWYEAPELENIAPVGWTAGESDSGDQSLRYRPGGHADPLLRNWFEALATAARSHPDEARREVAASALVWLVDDSSGPGACGRCHIGGIGVLGASGAAPDAASAGAEEAVLWGRRPPPQRSHVRFDHTPHIRLLGEDTGCRTCHRLDAAADFAAYFDGTERQASDFEAGFSPIVKATCQQCHKPEKVRFDCQLCHTYHREPGFHADRASRSIVRRDTP